MDTIAPMPELVGDLSLFRMSRNFWYSNGRRLLPFWKKQYLKDAIIAISVEFVLNKGQLQEMELVEA